MGTGQLCETFARLPRPHDCLKAFNENTETQLQAQDNAERILFAVYIYTGKHRKNGIKK